MMKRGDKLHNAFSEDQQKLDSARQNNRINIAGNPWIRGLDSTPIKQQAGKT